MVTSLEMTNDPVIFAEHFRTGFVGRPSWTFPADQPGLGDQPSIPVEDERTPVRVAVLLRLLPNHCLTKKAHEQNAVVTVPTIDISQVLRRAATPTARDLLRVYVQEITEPGQSKSTALAVRKQLLVLPGESWTPLAHRTLLHTRAANVQSYKPHAMEETYYWRCIAGDQLQDHCERIIGVFIKSDTNPFHPVLHDLRSAIRKNLNRQALNEDQLLTRQIIDRGIAAQAIYGDFLQELSYLSHLYSPPLTGDSQPRSSLRTPTRNSRQRLSAVASDRRPRHPISPMRDVFGTRPAVATITDAAARPHHSSKNNHKRSLDTISSIISSFRSDFSDDDPQDSPLENANDSTVPSDVLQDDHQDHDTQDIANDHSIFANKPAPRPGIGTLLHRRLFPSPQPHQTLRTHTATPATGGNVAASKGPLLQLPHPARPQPHPFRPWPYLLKPAGPSA